MGWLEDLKERVALGEDVDREKYYVTSVNLATLDRLIAIAKGAEWGGRRTSVKGKPACPICGWVLDNGHHPTCPYHEDWKP